MTNFKFNHNEFVNMTQLAGHYKCSDVVRFGAFLKRIGLRNEDGSISEKSIFFQLGYSKPCQRGKEIYRMLLWHKNNVINYLKENYPNLDFNRVDKIDRDIAKKAKPKKTKKAEFVSKIPTNIVGEARYDLIRDAANNIKDKAKEREINVPWEE